MTKPRQHGFTLIELIIFIVVVSVGMVGILSVMNTVVKSSADPMVRKQAMALAESSLEEIMIKEYCDPNTATLAPPAAPVCLGAEQETLRADYDDVDDYNGKTQTVFLDLPSSLSTYSVLITVETPAAVSGVVMKQVTVAVTGGGNTISLTGYRANY
jgi:MSHA pilin protein MshD